MALTTPGIIPGFGKNGNKVHVLNKCINNGYILKYIYFLSATLNFPVFSVCLSTSLPLMRLLVELSSQSRGIHYASNAAQKQNRHFVCRSRRTLTQLLGPRENTRDRRPTESRPLPLLQVPRPSSGLTLTRAGRMPVPRPRPLSRRRPPLLAPLPRPGKLRHHARSPCPRMHFYIGILRADSELHGALRAQHMRDGSAPSSSPYTSLHRPGSRRHRRVRKFKMAAAEAPCLREQSE